MGVGLWRVVIVITARAALPSESPADFWSPAPFEAALDVESAYVHLAPDSRSPIVGLLQRGDRVTVTGCDPDCGSGGWGLLGGDGAVRLRLLRPAAGPAAPSGPFLHGKVLDAGATVLAAPDSDAEELRREPAGHVLALVPNEPLFLRGWLERPGGGFVRAREVHLETPSPLRGERNPVAPLALFRRETELLDESGNPTGVLVPKYGRLRALGIDPAGRVRVQGGTVVRAAVQLAFQRPRPRDLSPETRWVHVDLHEQVLTAYQGDALVFATLISTGAPDRETAPGLFQVFRKMRDCDMVSERWGYHIEKVPFALFFAGDESLHGTFWHDRFGTALTHGCVNLSLADAEWLFEWAPPPLPRGWQAVMPAPGRQTLWVMVERASPGAFPRLGLPGSPERP